MSSNKIELDDNILDMVSGGNIIYDLNSDGMSFTAHAEHGPGNTRYIVANLGDIAAIANYRAQHGLDTNAGEETALQEACDPITGRHYATLITD